MTENYEVILIKGPRHEFRKQQQGKIMTIGFSRVRAFANKAQKRGRKVQF